MDADLPGKVIRQSGGDKMKCPICGRNDETPTVDCLARHLADVHHMEKLRAGRLAQLARDWAEYEQPVACQHHVEEGPGTLSLVGA